MSKGLLQIEGTLDVAQLWPHGGCDADTAVIVVDAGAIRYRSRHGDVLRPTRALDDAIVVGRVRKPALGPGRRLTVRLQGVDAPELHYRPPAEIPRREREPQQTSLFDKHAMRFRQHRGESATLALRAALLGDSPDRTVLRCRVTTAVDHPGDAFDTYGRLVGDLHVETANGELFANRWLLAKGWALPAFYASMTPGEIAPLRQLAREARQKRHGVWADPYDHRAQFDWGLVYRPPPVTMIRSADHGPRMFPKLFRRLCAWKVNRRAHMTEGTFREYVAGKSDACFELDAFLRDGPRAATMKLADAMSDAGTLQAKPSELVFAEAPSHLLFHGR